MNFDDALDKMDHHYQMIALWEELHRHLQAAVDVQMNQIAVNPSIRSTMVGSPAIRTAQEHIREQLDYHKKMKEQYGVSMLDPKTIPQEGLPGKEEKKDDKEKPAKNKKDTKPKPKPEPEPKQEPKPEAEGAGKEPAAEGGQEAVNG